MKTDPQTKVIRAELRDLKRNKAKVEKDALAVFLAIDKEHGAALTALDKLERTLRRRFDLSLKRRDAARAKITRRVAVLEGRLA